MPPQANQPDNLRASVIDRFRNVAAVLLFGGIALSLGSLRALIPTGLTSLLLIVRTQWEDERLQAEPAG